MDIVTQRLRELVLTLKARIANLETQIAQGGSSGGLTDAQLRASPVPISGTFSVSGGLTNTELRASAVPVSLASLPAGMVSVSNFPATQPVSGTFWQATQPVSIASLPALAAGANVIGGVTQSGTWNVGVTGSVAVTGAFWQATQPVSAASLPLPSGAATSAKQPALGTAGAAATDVLSVQGITGMTALKVDGSGVTQPVSGTVSVSGTIPVSGTFWQATQPVSGTITANAGTGTFAISAASLPLPSGAATSANQPSNIAAASTTSGQTGIMNIGAVTTAAPTYTTGQSNFFSLTTAGALRVDGSGATQPVSGTVTVGNASLAVTQSGPWNIGSITTLPALVAGSAIIGKVGLDQTTPGTTNAVSLAQIGANTILTGNGVTGTGSPRVTIASDQTAFTVNAAQSGTWTVQPGNTANTTPWLVKPHDGTNAGTIKAASTAAAFTDTALVVDARPGGALVTASAALADATANPTLGLQAHTNFLFNGSTWDRARGMSGSLTTGDTGAKTATGNGATQTNVGNSGVQILIVLGTVSGTTPTCVFKVQGSVDGGTTWYDVPGAATASLTATGNFGITVYPGVTTTAGTTTSGTTAASSQILPRNWRVVWTIGGTTPSFTITNIQYNYLVN